MSRIVASSDWRTASSSFYRTPSPARRNSKESSTLASPSLSAAVKRAALRAGAFALLVGMALPLAAQTTATRFIPTFLVYYGGGPTLTAADAPTLGKFDLIDIDRFRYTDIGSQTWAAIKAVNPNSQIYLYEDGVEVQNQQDSFAQVSLNNLGRYNVSRGHPMGSLNGNHPEFFQKDASGNRIYDSGFSNTATGSYYYLLDFGSSAYQSYWLTGVQADIVSQPWKADGIFVDLCMTFPASAGYNATSTTYPTNAAWSAAMNSFSSAITAGAHGFGQKLWCNKGDSRSAAGKSAWLALDSSASPPDVLLEEGAFAVMWGAAVQFFPESDWKNQVDTLAAMKNSKSAVMSHTQLEADQTGTDNYGQPVSFWQALWYSLGSFALGKNDTPNNAYFMFNGGSGYNKIWWFTEYDKINLGKALAPYTVTAVGGVNIYSREFENGYVYVNPTPNAVASVTLPQASRQLTHANLLTAPDTLPSVNSIAVPAHNAVILLKVVATSTSTTSTTSTAVPFTSTSTTSSTDTQAPSVPAGLQATVVSGTQINLTWNASTDNVGVKGYYVYLNDVALTTTTGTSFQHTGLVPGTTYNYRVSAFDAVPNHSAWTATAVSATTPLIDTQVPSVPSGLKAKAVSATEIYLSWNASTDNVGVKGYYVYLNDVAIAITTRTTYKHFGLAPGTTYNYRVSAFDAVPNFSAWTPIPVSATTFK